MKKNNSRTILSVVSVLLILSFGLINLKVEAAEIQNKRTVTVKLPTLQCDMCVNTISKALNIHDGILKVKINKTKKTAKITYNSDKITVAEIENAITSAGYDANDKSADPAAYEKLSMCCKKH
ncbi:hypothetical protein BH10BAC5_BH10BAC5_02340 [soil metagenome]